MRTNRCIELQKRIEELESILSGLEQDYTESQSHGAKSSINQKISNVEADIQKFREKYWSQLAGEINGISVPEDIANITIAEVIHQAELVETIPSTSEEMIAKLKELLVILKRTESPVSSRLKAAIPLLPGFITYEVDINASSFLKRIYPSFCKLLGK
jgi:hypothetical protein